MTNTLGRQFDSDTFFFVLTLSILIALSAFTIKMLMPRTRSFRAPAVSLALRPPANDDAPVYDPEAGLSAAELIGRWQPFIVEASRRFSIPEEWIRAVMRAESGGRTMLNGQPITSNAGAAGPMQLMQGTYEEMSAQHRLGSDVYNPHDNILAAAAYLKILKRRYGFPTMFAAYNAGPTRVDQHLTQGTPLPAETRNYLVNVVKYIAPVHHRHARRTMLASNG